MGTVAYTANKPEPGSDSQGEQLGEKGSACTKKASHQLWGSHSQTAISELTALVLIAQAQIHTVLISEKGWTT